MKPLEGFRHIQIERRIAHDFGDGILKGDRYLFDQIRLPTGWTERRLTPSELVDIVSRIGNVIVLFDRHPNNFRFIIAALQELGFPLAISGAVDSRELELLLAFDKMDMYVTTTEGELLAIPCHEDSIVNGIRQIWSPLRPESSEAPS